MTIELQQQSSASTGEWMAADGGDGGGSGGAYLEAHARSIRPVLDSLDRVAPFPEHESGALVHSGSHSTGRDAQLLRHLRSDAQTSCRSRRPAQVGKHLFKKVVQRLPETTGRQGLLPHMHVSPVACALRSRALLAWERQGCASPQPPAMRCHSTHLLSRSVPCHWHAPWPRRTPIWLPSILAVATCGPR